MWLEEEELLGCGLYPSWTFIRFCRIASKRVVPILLSTQQAFRFPFPPILGFHRTWHVLASLIRVKSHLVRLFIYLFSKLAFLSWKFQIDQFSQSFCAWGKPYVAIKETNPLTVRRKIDGLYPSLWFWDLGKGSQKFPELFLWFVISGESTQGTLWLARSSVLL